MRTHIFYEQFSDHIITQHCLLLAGSKGLLHFWISQKFAKGRLFHKNNYLYINFLKSISLKYIYVHQNQRLKCMNLLPPKRGKIINYFLLNFSANKKNSTYTCPKWKKIKKRVFITFSLIFALNVFGWFYFHRKISLIKTKLNSMTINLIHFFCVSLLS